MATVVYTNRCKQAFPGVPVIIGGIEASLRRLSHYDYWKDRVKRSILLDSKAHILVYGNGEKQAVTIAQRLKNNEPVERLIDIPGTVIKSKTLPVKALEVPSHEQVSMDKKEYLKFFKLLTLHSDKVIAQKTNDWYLIQNLKAKYEMKDLDRVFDFSYTRAPHFSYEKRIPAFDTVKNSIQSHRGCSGGCSFCAIYYHEGKEVVSRSESSIIREAKNIAKHPHFRGTIDNVGGPTANMYKIDCKIGGCTKRVSCLFPKICKNLIFDHKYWIKLLREVKKIPGINHVFVESGIRYDLLMQDNRKYIEEFCKNHITGQLKIAPEHVSPQVLKHMRKPSYEFFKKFLHIYKNINRELGKKQYVVPYFMSSHPGCGIKEMIELSLAIKKLGHFPEHVQDFTPTPMTLASCMFYTGYDPLTNKEVYVAKSSHEKKIQRALMQYDDPKNYDLIHEALKKEKRQDLIGDTKEALISFKKKQKRKKGNFKRKR